MNYGKKKISRRYDSVSAEQELAQQRSYKRSFEGDLQLVNRGGETFTQSITNGSSAVQRIAFFGGVFQSATELNTVLGESVNAIFGIDSVGSVVFTNAVQTKVAQRHFSYNPSRVARLEVLVDAAHQSQLNRNLTIASYSPTRKAGSVDKNLQVTVKPTNFQTNKAVLYPDCQIDSQTCFIMDILAGATVDISYVMGANINPAAALYAATRGLEDEV
jgi:hypothetical protein